MLDEASLPKLEWFQRDRPLVTLHHVCRRRADRGPQLQSLQTAAPGVGGHGASRGWSRPAVSGSSTWPATATTTKWLSAGPDLPDVPRIH